MKDGFEIENLDKFEKMIFQTAKTHFPKAVQRMLESLGQALLREAKRALKNIETPHARFEDWAEIGYGIEFVGLQNTNSIDQGGLWNSLTKGDPKNEWEYLRISNTFRLQVGTNLRYGKWLNDGYEVKYDHWVPGIVDSNGIFRYDPSSKTGLMMKARVHEGIHFYEVAMSELEKLAPKIIKRELQKIMEGFYGK